MRMRKKEGKKGMEEEEKEGGEGMAQGLPLVVVGQYESSTLKPMRVDHR